MAVTNLDAPHAAVRAAHQRAAELATNGSIEMSARDTALLPEAAELLPKGMSVFVPSLPKQALAATLDALAAIRRNGFDPVPHIAARRIADRDALRDFLQRAVQDCGVGKVLLVGGDEPQARGPYPDSLVLLTEGILFECGIREVGLPGYPEGHPHIPAPALQAAFAAKLAAVQVAQRGAFVVTQFSFAPARVVEYCTALARSVPEVAVYVGMAGPTEPASLLRYAQRCGVSASLRALRTLGMDAVKMVSHTDPREQLAAVAHYCQGHEACNVVGVHLFSFGGLLATARWMNRVIGAD